VDGYRDQELARLFVDSAWSQEELAERLSKKWGKNVSTDWVTKHLRLGRFLAFFHTQCMKDFSLPRNFTEGAFRRFSIMGTLPAALWPIFGVLYHNL